jgi:hypothetical protein
MSLYIYHKDLKVLTRNKLTKQQDTNYYKSLGGKLVITGFNEKRSIHQQIAVYEEYIRKIQKIKRYKLRIEDIDYYVCCVLALWKLGKYDPDDATSPIYISPKKKKKEV